MKSKITLKTVGIISCAVILTVALAGGVIAFARPMATPQSDASVTESYIDESEAKAIALAHAGLNETDVSHLLCKLDHDNGIAEYEVEFWDGKTEYDYEINAVSGEVIGYDYDMESYDAKPVTTATATDSTEYIGKAEAHAIALAHAGLNETDVSHLLCKLDHDNGIAEYEVEFWDGKTEYDYEINAVSGEVIGYDYDMESYDAKPVTTATATDSTEYIGKAEAQAIALAHAGVIEDEAGHIKCEFEIDDGYAEYEVEWEIGRTEYEYTISAIDGAIWEYDVE